jgi:flagellar basal-body rod modification protein FlgD
MIITAPQMFDSTSSTNSTSSAASANATLASEGLNPDDFMTLLVAEIQNQDPTQPMDPTTFMSQLVDLNQLEQVTQINQVVQEYAPTATTSSSTD